MLEWATARRYRNCTLASRSVKALFMNLNYDVVGVACSAMATTPLKSMWHLPVRLHALTTWFSLLRKQCDEFTFATSNILNQWPTYWEAADLEAGAIVPWCPKMHVSSFDVLLFRKHTMSTATRIAWCSLYMMSQHDLFGSNKVVVPKNSRCPKFHSQLAGLTGLRRFFWGPVTTPRHYTVIHIAISSACNACTI